MSPDAPPNAGPHPGSLLLRAYSDFTRDPSAQHFTAMIWRMLDYQIYKQTHKARAVAEHADLEKPHTEPANDDPTHR